MKKVFSSMLAAIMSVIAFAQEKKAEIDVDINKGGSEANWMRLMVPCRNF